MAAVHPSLSTHIESNDSINQNNIINSPLNSPGPVIKLCINIKDQASSDCSELSLGLTFVSDQALS